MVALPPSLPCWHFIKHAVGSEDGEHDAGADMPSLAGHGTATARSSSWAWGSSTPAAATSLGTDTGELTPIATAGVGELRPGPPPS
jgi:hypothetical protein